MHTRSRSHNNLTTEKIRTGLPIQAVKSRTYFPGIRSRSTHSPSGVLCIIQVEYMLFRIELPFVESIEKNGRHAKEIAANVKAGCNLGLGYDSVLGQETLAGYSTTVFQWNFLYPDTRVTAWRAPKLGCMELRRTLEERRPDGTYRLVSEKRPVTTAR
jgi:hypothetical protein